MLRDSARPPYVHIDRISVSIESDNQPLVMRGEITSSRGDPPTEFPAGRRDYDLASDCIAVAGGALKRKAYPGIVLADVVAQQYRLAI